MRGDREGRETLNIGNPRAQHTTPPWLLPPLLTASRRLRPHKMPPLSIYNLPPSPRAEIRRGWAPPTHHFGRFFPSPTAVVRGQRSGLYKRKLIAQQCRKSRNTCCMCNAHAQKIIKACAFKLCACVIRMFSAYDLWEGNEANHYLLVY